MKSITYIATCFLLATMLCASVPVMACKSKKKITKIEMTRTPCYGTCPWYSIVIDDQGEINYDGKKFVKNEGPYSGTLNEDDVQEIFDYAAEMRVDTLSERYDMGVMDLPGLRFVFTDKKGVESNVLVLSGGPQELQSLAGKIDALLDRAWRDQLLQTGASSDEQ